MALKNKVSLLARYPQYALPGMTRTSVWAFCVCLVLITSILVFTLIQLGISPFIVITPAIIIIAVGLFLVIRNFSAIETRLAVADPKTENTDKRLKCLFSQFQPLLHDVDLLKTKNGNWVGLGHIDKVQFARNVTISAFLTEHNPDILTLDPSSEPAHIAFSELPDTMSSAPLKSIRHIHYQYAKFNMSTNSLTISSAQEPNSFAVTYLSERNLGKIEKELLEHDTTLNKIVSPSI